MATATHETKPQIMTAVITSGSLEGESVIMTVAHHGAIFGDVELTPEEMEALEAVVEASKKAEASAIRAGKTAERIIEKRRLSIARLRGEKA